MIHYALICKQGHQFESWFQDSAAYDKQAKRGLVTCPQCGVWHHQRETDALRCWTYSPHCAMCDQPTDLSAGYRWTPQGL